MDTKKLSVIIPNYNYADYIEKRIQSVLNQTYPIFEILVLDDASSDNSCEIIESVIRNNQGRNIRLIKNATNSGSVFKQWNKGVSLCQGDYFWIAEADDLCDSHFVENAMTAFDDSDVVLSYTDSAIIDENDSVIIKSSIGIFNIFQSSRWNHSYVENGITEVKNYLSSVNTIINASSVIWKKNDYSDLFKQAESFHVAGDWYIYAQVLKTGKIAYCSKALNFCRKHVGSVSNAVKDDTEYLEICRIQDQIAEEFAIDMTAYRFQRLRRTLMSANVSKETLKKKVAWTIPVPGKGSGGHRTIIQNINALIKAGYECDLFVPDDGMVTEKYMERMISEYYEPTAAKIHIGFDTDEEYDLFFVTGWQTIGDLNKVNAKKKAYFVQDYEPWFFPMGDRYIEIENSYRMGLPTVTIGRWLAQKLQNEFGADTRSFDFCADTEVYRKLENVRKENAICCIYQPEKDRRCTDILNETLLMISQKHPDVKIYLYGSAKTYELPFSAEQLGIISVQECNELYNRCTAGICMSSSNPSRIPFEMMAAGLPVVDLYRENNLYDMPTNGVLLGYPTPESLTEQLELILCNADLAKQMSEFGCEYMKAYPLETGFKQFADITKEFLKDSSDTVKQSCEMLYTNHPGEMNTAHIGASLQNIYVHRRMAGIRRKIVQLKELNQKTVRKIKYIVSAKVNSK